jgi:DNA-binding CsgD family transcriptional regulator
MHKIFYGLNMSKNDFWVSSQLANDILNICGNPSPTFKQSKLIMDLLSYVIVNPAADNICILSERERTCLFWVAHGKTVKEMAPLMQVKACTVQTYRRRILSKLKCDSLSQAVFLAMCYQPTSSAFANIH